VTFLNKSFAAKAAPTSAPLLVGVPLGTNKKSTADVDTTNNIHLPTFDDFFK
jgi:hypothetical protein